MIPTQSGPGHVIAIGGSTGAIPALATILGHLPATFPAAVLVTIHVGAEGLNQVANILSKNCALPVMTAEEGEEVQAGHVYVAPSDRHLLLIDGCTRLGRGPRENLTRPAIDPMFRSVALDQGPRAIGVILSGLLNDGACGLAAIRRCGGTAAVQNPADAVAVEMPLGALSASDVDYRAPAADLGRLLQTLLEMPLEADKGPAPEDIVLEVDIALGRPCDSALIERIATPCPLTCPACGGVMSEMRRPPLRFRCQVGHAYTAEAFAAEKDSAVDEAVRVALRIVEERATLTEKMSEDARKAGRRHAETSFRARAEDLRDHAETLRAFAIGGLWRRPG